MSKLNTFYPFQGIGKISFGDSRDDIKHFLNENPKTFLRNEFAENTSDYYKNFNFFVEFDTQDLCNAIEFTSDANLYFQGDDLLKKSYQELLNQFNQISNNKEFESDIGVTFYDLGFGAMKAENGGIESIIIFSRTYWD